jgi:hypothetical protein
VVGVSWSRIRHILGKDLHLGPRSPLVLWALVLPVAMTLLLRGVFGGLFAGEPRLGIVDLGRSELVAQAQQVPGLQVTLLDDVDELRTRVEDDDLDAGSSSRPGSTRPSAVATGHPSSSRSGARASPRTGS